MRSTGSSPIFWGYFRKCLDRDTPPHALCPKIFSFCDPRIENLITFRVHRGGRKSCHGEEPEATKADRKFKALFTPQPTLCRPVRRRAPAARQGQRGRGGGVNMPCMRLRSCRTLIGRRTVRVNPSSYRLYLSGEGRAIQCTWSKQRTTARRSGPQGAGAVGQPALSVVTRIVDAAHWCFCDPHMQEPNIPPLFQTISKAASPKSFLETKRLAGPIRVILGTCARGFSVRLRE